MRLAAVCAVGCEVRLVLCKVHAAGAATNHNLWIDRRISARLRTCMQASALQVFVYQVQNNEQYQVFHRGRLKIISKTKREPT